MLSSFPLTHQAALTGSLPGSSVSTDIFGTTVTLPRTFTPSPVLLDRSFSNLIATGSPFSNIYFAAYSDPQTKILDKSTVVVCVDGACSNNGTPDARAGLGVYFGPASPHNASETITGVQTSQRAEIRAAVHALEIVRRVLLDDTSIRTVVVVCDSRYVVQGVTELVFRWKENGWKTSSRQPVVNSADFQELDELIDELQEEGIDVEFWKVDREDNGHADELAKRACEAS